MMTLNERVYCCLLSCAEPVTAHRMASMEEFRDVSAMAVGRALLEVTAQHAASYRVVNGKMYFSADTRWGRMETGAQENLNKMSAMSDAMSSLMSGGKPNASALLGMSSQPFPLTGEGYPAYFNRVEFDSRRWEAKEFSICFPKGAHVTKNPDDKHQFQADCPVDGDEDGESMVLWTSINALEGDAPSRDASFAQAKMLADHFCNMVNTNGEEAEIYRDENVDAAFSLSTPNSFIIVAMPQGLLNLRIDWNVEQRPSEDLVREMVIGWLKTYRYAGRTSYYEPRKLAQVPLAQLPDEIEKSLNSQNRIINAAKVTCTNNKSKKSFVKKLLNCRGQLERAAAGLDEYVVEYMAMLRYHAETCKDPVTLNTLYNGGLQLFNLCADITAEVEVPNSAIGPYNSATDVVFGANVKPKTYTIDVYPAHSEELLRLVTLDRLEKEKTTGNSAEAVRRFYKEQVTAMKQALAGEVHYPDFKMEGNTIAAYLGSDKDVTIPEGVRAIGDFAFKGCPELETVTLSQSVERLGFAVFEGCPKLRTITMSPELSSVAGPLRGMDGVIYYGRRKDKNGGLKLRVYADTFSAEYAKENDYVFEIIPEEPKEPVLDLSDAKPDAFHTLMLPLPKGFLSSNGKPGVLSGELEHLKYAAVPADTPGGLEGYKDARFSVTCTMDTMNVPNALKIAPEAEQRLNNVEHVHQQYRTCTAENGKIIIRYDLVREGEMEGVRWGQYLVLMFHGNSLDSVQIFINGDYTRRQQEQAVRRWAEKIRFAGSVKKEQEQKAAAEAAEKARKEAASAAAAYEQQMQEYNQAYAQWQKDKSRVEKQRSADLNSKLATVRAAKKQELDAAGERTLGYAQARLDYAEAQKAAAEAELSKLGFFRFAEKKVVQTRIRTMAEKADAARREINDLQQTQAENSKKLDSHMKELEKALRKDLEVTYPMPPEPQKPQKPAAPRPERTGYNTSGMTAVGIANAGIKEAILETLAQIGRGTVVDIQMNCPAAEDLTNQRVSALVRQLVSEGRVIRTEENRKAYFELA